jgi:hypothetical protein
MDLEDLEQFKNLTHLIMALQGYNVFDPHNTPPEYTEIRDTWSTALLVTYIGASQSAFGALWDKVHAARDQDLCTIVWTDIELLAKTDLESRVFVRSFRRDTPVPSDFPPCVDPYIAWTYGKLLGMAAQRLLVGDRIAETLATQWVKDSVLWERDDDRVD